MLSMLLSWMLYQCTATCNKQEQMQRATSVTECSAIAQDEDKGMTALMHACNKGAFECVKLLHVRHPNHDYALRSRYEITPRTDKEPLTFTSLVHAPSHAHS
jgi:hypothetical protein